MLNFLSRKTKYRPSFREYFYNLNSTINQNNEYRLQNISISLLAKIKNIKYIRLKSYNHQLSTHKQIPKYLWDLYINKLIDDISLEQINVWLSYNCKETYSETVKRLMYIIYYNFNEISRYVLIWENQFRNDEIFKYIFCDEPIKELTQFGEDLFRNYIKLNNFSYFEINSTVSEVDIAFLTSYESYPNNLTFISLSNRLKLIDNIEKQITIEDNLELSKPMHGYSIKNLNNFYKNTLFKLEKLERPQKFMPNKKNKNSLENFKSICDYFNSRFNLFEYKTSELIDVIDSDSNIGTMFNIDKDKEPYFYLFIDSIINTCVKTGNIYDVIRDRFTISGEGIIESDATLRQRKRRYITNKTDKIIKERLDKFTSKLKQ